MFPAYYKSNRRAGRPLNNAGNLKTAENLINNAALIQKHSAFAKRQLINTVKIKDMSLIKVSALLIKFLILILQIRLEELLTRTDCIGQVF